MFERLKRLGPGVLVTAAFIGPGTVTTSTLAGANYGYALLWVLLFATFATIILQEMAARLGTVTQKGLAEVLLDALRHSTWKWPLILLIGIALFAGNSAFEAGNLAGAALGVDAILPGTFRSAIVVLVLLSGLVLIKGNYQQIERLLVALVLLMAIAFVLTFIVVKPDLGAMLSGMFKPSMPSGSLLTIIALIGTTVVPYNLFLHASAAKNRWSGAKDLQAAKTDTILSIGLGGLIAMLIVSTASASLFAKGISVNNANEMAIQFEPLFGFWAKYLMGVGLFAAGLSSAITAPLATAYALSDISQLTGEAKLRAFRWISLSVLIIGAGFALADIKPIKVILLAQFANGLLLPIVTGFLLFAMNHRDLLGDYANSRTANILGAAVFIFTAFLGLRVIGKVMGLA
ncbi:MAG: Nramp family divalent metal transporter [Pseudomonadales bacterium]|jgi:manganese transport protein|tara:strand:- start:660 stop:1868 length:1209 start_codon:yes stop_codon:yes gene_type:complete